MSVGERIKELRIAKHMTQQQLADKCHVSKQSVCIWESDKQGVKNDNLVLLCDIFNVSMDYLTGLIRCPACGSRYITHTSNYKEGMHYTYYTCPNRRKKKCASTIIREEKADDLVVGEILKLSFEQPQQRPPADHSREISQIDRQISRLIDLYTVDGISQKDLTARIDALNKRKELLRIPPQIHVELPTKEAVNDIICNGSFRKRKDLVDSLIDKIEIDGDDMHIYWSW